MEILRYWTFCIQFRHFKLGCEFCDACLFQLYHEVEHYVREYVFVNVRVLALIPTLGRRRRVLFRTRGHPPPPPPPSPPSPPSPPPSPPSPPPVPSPPPAVALTDATFTDAISACLAEAADTGLCTVYGSESGYGTMPNWGRVTGDGYV